VFCCASCCFWIFCIILTSLGLLGSIHQSRASGAWLRAASSGFKVWEVHDAGGMVVVGMGQIECEICLENCWCLEPADEGVLV